MSRALFTPYKFGGDTLKNRIVMAPMTRARTTQPGDIPNALMAEYYAQRAGAGLIVTEATQISAASQGYSFTPGVYSAEQVNGWRKVTDAVHAAGGRIYLQLWHVGRVSHPVFHDGGQPVAPSAIQPQGTQVWVVGDDGVGRMLDCPMPRALTVEEIAEIVEDFRVAARNAMTAGFDGVEIHGANGYLVDQFLRSVSNQRDDDYGGSPQKRLRFLQEVVNAVADEIGAECTGIRLAPFVTFKDMADPEITGTILLAGEWLAGKVGYLHLSEADWDDAPQIPDDFRVALRSRFKDTIIVAGRYDEARAEAVLEAGWADLVAFGRPFVANPDLPVRLQHHLPLAALDPATLFGGNAAGYTDYPKFAAPGEPA
ncbi:alkene reductase [Jeongeupia naejangsanensis]|uniref:Alkene reductase n=1 Tax=Jeongeupia naejangsanensis TaxID=613195 RepID=A0ABS2BNF4_9NEIS|nr:alkene reductase [Jeongeupia naejangsanensis]MBM3117151.1 alkene reductase [Jeongeupia naejangsanensis]